jgi:hypothetical protein
MTFPFASGWGCLRNQGALADTVPDTDPDTVPNSVHVTFPDIVTVPDTVPDTVTVPDTIPDTVLGTLSDTLICPYHLNFSFV